MGKELNITREELIDLTNSMENEFIIHLEIGEEEIHEEREIQA